MIGTSKKTIKVSAFMYYVGVLSGKIEWSHMGNAMGQDKRASGDGDKWPKKGNMATEECSKEGYGYIYIYIYI